MSRYVYREENGVPVCEECDTPADCPFCHHLGHYEKKCQTQEAKPSGPYGPFQSGPCDCYPYPEDVTIDLGDPCPVCETRSQAATPVKAPPPQPITKICHETLLKRLLSAGQLGFAIHSENGHRWVVYSPNGGANGCNLQEQYKKLPRCKCYGSLEDALDTIDAWLKERGFVDNLLEMFRDWQDQWGFCE